MTFDILFAPAVCEFVARRHQSGQVEVRWLTTWGSDANQGLRRRLGLPPFDVVPGAEAVAGPPAQSSAAYHGATVQQGVDGWWKLGAVERLVAQIGARPLIWTDDQITPEARAWVDEHHAGEHLLISPKPETGLTPADLYAIEEFIAG